MDANPKKPGWKRSAERNATRLQRWLDANGFTAAQLEQASAKYSRQALANILRRKSLRLSTMRVILGAARKLAMRDVQMQELFDLEPESNDTEET